MKISFPCRRWNSPNFWRRSGSENIHLNPGSPRPRRRTRKSSRRIWRVFFKPIPRLIVVWWWSKNWFVVNFRQHYLLSPRWTQSQTVRAERSIIPHSTEIRRRDQDYKYIIGTLMEIENCQMLYWMRNHRMDIPGPGERLTRKQTTSRPDSLWPEIWKDMSQARKKREAKVGCRKTEARQCQKIAVYLLRWPSRWGIQGHHEKCSLKVGKFRCQQQCLVKPSLCRSSWETYRATGGHKTKYLKLANLWESKWKELTDIMKIILQEKELIHWTTTILCTNLFLCLKQWKYQMRKQQWIRNGKTWKDTGMAGDKSQKQERGDRWSQE